MLAGDDDIPGATLGLTHHLGINFAAKVMVQAQTRVSVLFSSQNQSPEFDRLQ